MTAKSQPRLSIIPAGAVTDERLNAGDIRVLALLGRHTDRRGWCRRSQVRMAQELNASRGYVQKALVRLIETGWVEHRLEGRGKVAADPEKQPFASHSYRVILDRDDWPEQARDHSDEPDPSGGDDETEQGGAPYGAPPGAPPERARGATPDVAPGATSGVAPLERPLGNSPPVSEAPPTPPVGGAGASASRFREREFTPPPEYTPDFLSFWSRYPGHKAMHRRKAWPVWLAMSAFNRQWASNAVGPYGIELAKLKRKPVDAEKWLADGGFEEFGEHKPRGDDAAPPVRHLVTPDSVEWRAWAVIYRILGKTMLDPPQPVELGAPLPPDALALATFTPAPLAPAFDDIGDDPVDLGGWEIVERDSQPLGAWRQRIKEWTGRWVEPDRIYLGGLDRHGAKKRAVGLLVPCPWPPNKNRENP